MELKIASDPVVPRVKYLLTSFIRNVLILYNLQLVFGERNLVAGI